MQERADKIREYRLRQPLDELLRKVIKAGRIGVWTQEEIDYGEAKARHVLSQLTFE